MNAKHAKQTKDAKRDAARGESRGKRTFVGIGEWLTKSQIALKGHLDSVTVAKYLDLDGAPKPNEKRQFHFKTVMEWIQANSNRVAGANSVEMRKLKEAVLRIDAEERAFDFGVKRGQYVAMTEIEPAIAAFCSQLTADLRQKFEFELPDKYEGKGAVDRKVMNAEGIDWVLKRLKAGTGALVSKS